MASAHRKRLIIISTFRFYEKKRIHVKRKNIVGDELSTGTDILSLPSRRMYNECNYVLLWYIVYEWCNTTKSPHLYMIHYKFVFTLVHVKLIIEVYFLYK